MGSAIESWSKHPFPDFYIIGSAKTGTTTLAQHLAQHPKVCFSRAKEPEILRRELTDEQVTRSFDKMFAAFQPGQLRGEGSTAYTGWSNWRRESTESFVKPAEDPATAAQAMMQEIRDTARRMAKYSPKARILYMFRHPVDRIYSQVHYNTRHAAEPVDFEATLELEPRYVQVSHYADILRLYLECFPREQFLFTTLDEVIKDLPGLLNQVQDFLGIPRDPTINEIKVFTNEGKHHQLRRALSNRLRTIPGYQWLRKMTPKSVREGAFDVLKGSSLAKVTKAAPMKPETRQRLLSHFERPNQELRELTGIDISKWSK